MGGNRWPCLQSKGMSWRLLLWATDPTVRRRSVVWLSQKHPKSHESHDQVMKVMTKSSAVHWFPLTFHPLNPSPKPISSQFQESFQCQFQRPGAPGGTIHPPYIAGGKLRKCYGKLLDLIHSNRLKWHDGKKNTWWIWMYIVYHWWLSASEVYAFLVDQAQPEFDQGPAWPIIPSIPPAPSRPESVRSSWCLVPKLDSQSHHWKNDGFTSPEHCATLRYPEAPSKCRPKFCAFRAPGAPGAPAPREHSSGGHGPLSRHPHDILGPSNLSDDKTYLLICRVTLIK